MSDSTRFLDSSATLPATNDSLINPNVPILPRTLNVLRPDEGLGRRGTGPVLFSGWHAKSWRSHCAGWFSH
jgi:hypothetical protein